MYSSSSVSKRLFLVPVLAIQLLLIRTASSLNMTNAYLNHTCMVSQGKYKPGSAYERNLKSLITSIARTNNNIAGHDMRSRSDDNAFVSVILQCRGDSYGAKCRDCFAKAVAELRRRCPRYKGGMIWYDQCLLDISAVDSEGKIDYENNFCMSNAKKVIDDDNGTFDGAWMALMNNLTGIAVSEKNYSNPAALYAAGERRFRTTRFGTTKLYGMSQCTKDLSPEGCKECILFNLLRFQDCLFRRRGARFVGRSCNFRFEFYPFVTIKAGHKYLKS